MDFNKYLEMKPMKYVGGASAKKRLQTFLEEPTKQYKGWFASIKIDGEWSRIVHDLEGNVTIQGRGISRSTGLHKDNTESLPHLVKLVKETVPRGTVLIGELSFKDYMNTIQVDVGSILRSLPNKAIQRQQGNPLLFYAFDCLAYAGEDLMDSPYHERFNKVKEITSGESSAGIKGIYTMQIKNDKEVLDLLDQVLKDGGEGLMVINPMSKYLPEGRSVTVSLKIKKELGELTLKVVGTVDPKVDYNGEDPDGWLYKIDGHPVTKFHYNGWKAGVIVEYKDGTVKVVSGVTDEDAEWLATSSAAEMIGRGELHADVTAMSESLDSRTGVTSLRHPALLKLRTDL